MKVQIFLPVQISAWFLCLLLSRNGMNWILQSALFKIQLHAFVILPFLLLLRRIIYVSAAEQKFACTRMQLLRMWKLTWDLWNLALELFPEAAEQKSLQ